MDKCCQWNVADLSISNLSYQESGWLVDPLIDSQLHALLIPYQCGLIIIFIIGASIRKKRDWEGPINHPSTNKTKLTKTKEKVYNLQLANKDLRSKVKPKKREEKKRSAIDKWNDDDDYHNAWRTRELGKRISPFFPNKKTGVQSGWVWGRRGKKHSQYFTQCLKNEQCISTYM